MKKTICLFFSIALLCGFYQSCQPNVELPGGIYGTVLDKGSGEPIRNAEITLNPSGKTTVVGSNGTYEFVNLEAGMYTVNVQADGYDHNSKTANVVNGESTACDFHLTKTIINQDLEITPTSLNFGTTQNQLSVTITNRGTEETAWSLNLGNNAWLSATPKSGNIGARKTQTIVFSVNRTLMTKAESAVVSLAAFGNSYPLTISCEISKGQLSITPTILNFGEESSEQTFTIKNMGNAAITWRAKDLSVTCLSLSDMGGTLAVGASKVVKLTLDRTALTSDLSTSFIIADGFTEQEIQVSAKKKVLQSVLTLTPTFLDFGEDNTVLSFTIKNMGNAAMTWSAKGLSATCLSLSDMGGTVAVGASKVVKLTLDRTALTSDLSTSFTIVDGFTEQEVQVSATKKVLHPIMNVTPSILDFGDSSTSKTFTISNSGSADLHWSLTNASNECLSYSTTSGTISPAGSTTVTVTLNRAAMHTDLNTSIGVSDGTNSQSITIKATYVYVEDYSSATIESCSSDVKAEIISCKRNGSNVVFTYKLTNSGLGDVNIQIKPAENYTGASVIFDDLGNSYNRQYMTFRNQGNAYSNAIGVAFPEDVPCTGNVTVQNVPDEATKLTVKLGVWINQTLGNTYISFKNVPIY